MRKEISVVIPLYNSKDSICDVLKGIELQTRRDHILSVVVVNDGSTDGSENAVLEYCNNTSLNIQLINKTNGGVAAARNRGVKESLNAEWIAFCDSDDVWMPHKIERLLEIIEEHPDIDCIGSAYSASPLRIGTRTVNTLYRGTVKDILISNFPQPSTVLMKKDVFEKIGGFDENQHYAEDGNFFLRVAAYYNLYYLPEQLVIYGYGKRAFGVEGLSSNLKEMYNGNVKNMKETYQLGLISFAFYTNMRLYHWLKYMRRIIITKLTKFNRNK